MVLETLNVQVFFVIILNYCSNSFFARIDIKREVF